MIGSLVTHCLASTYGGVGGGYEQEGIQRGFGVASSVLFLTILVVTWKINLKQFVNLYINILSRCVFSVYVAFHNKVVKNEIEKQVCKTS